MLSLLFDSSFWYDVLLVVAIIAVIYILIKFPHAKIYVYTLIFIVLVGSGIYSTININSYYSASGGIYGILTGDFDKNNKLYVNEKVFTLENTTLTQKNGDTYSAKSISDEAFKVKTNEYLGVFVNDSPCTYSEIAEDYFVANYNYTFYDKNGDVLLNDTLKLYFAFYDKMTELEVVTDGGSTAVKYWGYYFNKNNFNVTIKSVKDNYNKDLTIGEGDVSNYAIVRYFQNDEEVYKQVCPKNTKIVFPTLDSSKVYKFKIKDTETYIDETFVVNSNLSINVEEQQGTWKTLATKLNFMALTDVPEVFTKSVVGLKTNSIFRVKVSSVGYSESTRLYSDNTSLDEKSTERYDKPEWGYIENNIISWNGNLWTAKNGYEGETNITIKFECLENDILQVTYTRENEEKREARFVFIESIEIFEY